MPSRSAVRAAKPAIIVFGKRVGTTLTVCTDNQRPVDDPRAAARKPENPAPIMQSWRDRGEAAREGGRAVGLGQRDQIEGYGFGGGREEGGLAALAPAGEVFPDGAVGREGGGGLRGAEEGAGCSWRRSSPSAVSGTGRGTTNSPSSGGPLVSGSIQPPCRFPAPPVGPWCPTVPPQAPGFPLLASGVSQTSVYFASLGDYLLLTCHGQQDVRRFGIIS